MNQLQQRSLANVPLTEETVLSFYDGSHSGTEKQCLRALCESHERLRAELQGAEVMLVQNEQNADKLSDCWLFLDSLARCSDAPISKAAESILKKQQAPGWKS